MKKILMLFLVACMCFTVLGCGKSKAVIEADNLIANIGEITLESQKKLQAAQQAVSNLTDRQKEQLENTALLESAQDTYDKLVAENADQAIASIGEVTLESRVKLRAAQQAVSDLTSKQKELLENTALLENAQDTYDKLLAEKVDQTIAAIGSVTLDSKKAIREARKLYDSCSDRAKSAVCNYTALQEAENEFSRQKVDNVINLINQIGTVTVNSGDKIKAAQTAYDALSEAEKSNVSNYSILSEAPQKLKTEKKQAAMSKLKSETDKVEGTTWYKASVHPNRVNERSYVLPYIGTKSDSTWLRLKYLYTGDSWIFFKSITVSVDGKRYDAEFSYWDVERDSNTRVWEWVDVSATNADIEMLKAIASSKETIVRFKGDQYHYGLVVSQSDKSGINDVLAAYEAMK